MKVIWQLFTSVKASVRCVSEIPSNHCSNYIYTYIYSHNSKKLYVIATEPWRNFWFYVYIHIHTLPYARIPRDTRTSPTIRLLQKQNAFSVHLKFWILEINSNSNLIFLKHTDPADEQPGSTSQRGPQRSLMSPPPDNSRHTEALCCVQNPFCYFLFSPPTVCYLQKTHDSTRNLLQQTFL